MALGPVSFQPEIENSVCVYIEIFCVACNIIACFQYWMMLTNKSLHPYTLSWIAEMPNSHMESAPIFLFALGLGSHNHGLVIPQ
jgi:hypothetical protein